MYIYKIPLFGQHSPFIYAQVPSWIAQLTSTTTASADLAETEGCSALRTSELQTVDEAVRCCMSVFVLE